MYKTVVPTEDVVAKCDFMYMIAIMDNAGSGKMFPDLKKDAPYVAVHLDRAAK
jgi:hypothetical protein